MTEIISSNGKVATRVASQINDRVRGQLIIAIRATTAGARIGTFNSSSMSLMANSNERHLRNPSTLKGPKRTPPLPIGEDTIPCHRFETEWRQVFLLHISWYDNICLQSEID